MARTRGPGPYPLVLGHTSLVGREQERRFLQRVLGEARQTTRLVFVSGEPGVGKSRLLAELARQAVGWRVLRGGAYEAQGQPPYVLFVDVLRAYLDQAGVGPARRRARLRLGQLRRLLPELDEEDLGELSPTDRQRLMELAAGFVRDLAAERPLLLVLDDLHWADSASLELLVYLRRRLRDVPLLCLAAYRDTDVDDEHPLTAAVVELNRLRLADELHPRRLAEAETAALLAALLNGPAATGLVAAIHTQSEGNPFFTEELVRALAEDELTGETSEACTTVERFIRALGARDLKGTLATYAPDAVWEVHVPGGDGLQRGVEEIGLLLAPFYIDRDGFDVAEYRMLDRAGTVALRCELHWLDGQDGAPCVSHQSHFFEVRGGRIERHWLYCSGVRVYAAAGHRHSPHGSTTNDPHEGR